MVICAAEQVARNFLCIEQSECSTLALVCRRHRRLVRHPNSIRASKNQGQGRGFILLPPRAASQIRCWQWWC